MATSSWTSLITGAFPSLVSEGFEIVDLPSTHYNCIAYAAGDTTEWWEHTRRRYWPPYATRSNSIASLREVFAGLGYEQCDDSRAEDGYRKIALYETQGVWTHAAVQMPNGAWRSKMGEGPVIEHRSPESLSGGIYGNATVYMRKSISSELNPD